MCSWETKQCCIIGKNLFLFHFLSIRLVHPNPYQIATASKIQYVHTNKNKFHLQTIRICDFRSFVDSKAKHEVPLKGINFHIVIEVSKYCEASKRYIVQNSSTSDSAEFLGIYFSWNNPPRRGSYKLDAMIKFVRKCVFDKYTFNFNPPENQSKLGFETKIEVFIFL